MNYQLHRISWQMMRVVPSAHSIALVTHVAAVTNMPCSGASVSTNTNYLLIQAHCMMAENDKQLKC